MPRALGKLALLALLAAACGNGDSGDGCVEVDLGCAPLYEPTFDQIFSRTLAPKCGIDGAACHSRDGAMNGLILVDPDESHDLLSGSDGRERMVPGDPGCSLIVKRLESHDPVLQMPPGSPLAEAERCVITRWIADGAAR